MIRNCLYCRHCEIESGWGGTEETPGHGTTIKCKKGHWDIEHGSWENLKPALRENLEKATTCTEFQAEP